MYIYIVSEHRHLSSGIPVTTNHYYFAESEDKAKAKYEELCAKCTRLGYKCVHDDRFGEIEEIDGKDIRCSFRDYTKNLKNGKKDTRQVEIGVEIIK